MADNWIKFKAQAVEDTINTLVEESKRQATADEYQKQMDQTTGKISVIGIYKVCAAAGKDIRTNDGYSQCRYFINQLAEKSDFGTKSANQANCANMFNGIWSLSKDGKEYQCVGKDGHKLVYSKSCDGDSGDCIKDFAGLKTQGPNGREFIAAWAKKKNIDLTCYIGFETRRGVTSPLGQDYIKCSAGGKSYEFEFDSLNETPGKTSMDSENKTICEFYGGKIVDTSDAANEKLYKSCDIEKAICYGDISSLASKTGHTVMYQGYCRLSREPKSKSIIDLKHIDGVDNRVFYNSGAQMRADMAKVQLEEYLHNTFPNEKYIVCDPSIKPYDYGLGLDKDYILTCTVGSKQVDFLFDDLSESSKSRADTGMDAMQCITSGGTFKGETCRGPTEEECTALDTALRAKGSTEGASWDKSVRACILGNAMKTYKRDVATGYVVGAVVIVGGAIVTIGTGGAAVPVIVGGAEMLVTDLAMNYAIDWNHRRLSRQAANRYGSFLVDATECKDEPCALKVLKKHYASLSGVMDDLNKDDKELINYEMDKLINLINTEYVACGKNDAGQIVYATQAECAMKSSTLRVIDHIDKASEPVLIIASVIYNPGYVTARFTKLKKISKIAKLDDAMDVAHMSANDRKFYEAYKKYGNRSETLDAFKTRFGNDYSRLEEEIKLKNWHSWEEVDLTGDVPEGLTVKVEPNYHINNPEIAELITDADEALKFSEIRKATIEDNPVWREIDNIVHEEHMSGKISSEEILTRWNELAAQHGTSYGDMLDKAFETQRKYKKTWNEVIIPNNVSIENKDFVIAERVQLYSEVVDKDPELRRMATNFDKLTDEEKVVFGQKILDESGKYTASGKYQYKSAAQWEAENPGLERTWVGSHDKYKKTIYTDMKTDGKTLPEFMNNLAHEDGHKIDYWSPEMGMLGEQKAKLNEITYSNKSDVGYMSTMTEQSSYPIGDAVGKDFERLQNYRFTTPGKYLKNTENTIDKATAAGAVGATVMMGEVDLLTE